MRVGRSSPIVDRRLHGGRRGPGRPSDVATVVVDRRRPRADVTSKRLVPFRDDGRKDLDRCRGVPDVARLMRVVGPYTRPGPAPDRRSTLPGRIETRCSLPLRRGRCRLGARPAWPPAWRTAGTSWPSSLPGPRWTRRGGRRRGDVPALTARPRGPGGSGIAAVRLASCPTTMSSVQSPSHVRRAGASPRAGRDGAGEPRAVRPVQSPPGRGECSSTSWPCEPPEIAPAARSAHGRGLSASSSAPAGGRRRRGIRHGITAVRGNPSACAGPSPAAS